MLVGTKVIIKSELLKNIKSMSALESYVISLIPKEMLHIPEIIDNQKYLVACYLRQMQDIDYETRYKLYSGLLKNVKLCGTLDEVYDFNDIRMSVDLDKVFLYLKGENYAER